MLPLQAKQELSKSKMVLKLRKSLLLLRERPTLNARTIASIFLSKKEWQMVQMISLRRIEKDLPLSVLEDL